VDGDRAVSDLVVAKPISTTHHTGATAIITRSRGAVQDAPWRRPMPMYRPDQRSFLDLQREEVQRVEQGTLVWLLVRYRDAVLPEWLTRGWTRGKGRRGRKAWPVQAVLALALLRWSEGGMSRLGACRRAKTDGLWRYAMGLPVNGKTPTEKTVREVEAWLLQEHEGSGVTRLEAWWEHVVHVALWSARARGCPAPRWFMDSTPMWCFGAVLDTIRLLGDGLRRLGRAWAQATDCSLKAVATAWELPLLTAESTKGWLRLDWSNAEARSSAVSDLVDAVLRVSGRVKAGLRELGEADRRRVADLCDLLLRVVEQDLEKDEDGRWRVARKVAPGRMVSLTDPEAGHGHKSRSESFWGYKINVFGDLASGVVAAVSVTRGNGHDAAPGHALVVEARRMRLEIGQVLADTAYGGIENRLALAALGVDVVAPPPGGAREEGERFSKNDFAIDFEAGTATCPAGVTTDQAEKTRAAVPTQAFRWPVATCAACPLQEKCLQRPIRPAKAEAGGRTGRPRKTGRRLVLDAFERERREARDEWQDPERRELYRDRSMGERLNALLVQHGARQARSSGRPRADLQAHLIGMVVNLGVLARNVAEAEAEERARRAPRPPTRRQRAVAAQRDRAERVAAQRDAARQLALA
jgi:hypothetical protein